MNCGMYKTWSIVDKFRFSANHLVVRTEFYYEEFYHMISDYGLYDNCFLNSHMTFLDKLQIVV